MVRAEQIPVGHLAIVVNINAESSLARVVELDRNLVKLHVFRESKGFSTSSSVRFLGHPMEAIYSSSF